MNDKRKTLTVHVIGAGKGEIIITSLHSVQALQMPNGEWGVVDCYAPLVQTEITLKVSLKGEADTSFPHNTQPKYKWVQKNSRPVCVQRTGRQDEFKR